MARILFVIQLLTCMLAAVLAIDKYMLRTWFKCDPCNQEECNQQATDCIEYVKEPGVCSCCLMCAKMEGESCGVNLPRCAKGLECTPIFGDTAKATWKSFMADKALCLPRSKYGEQFEITIRNI